MEIATDVEYTAVLENKEADNGSLLKKKRARTVSVREADAGAKQLNGHATKKRKKGLLKKIIKDSESAPRPSDWPAATGALDLAVHDLPHESSDTEWWYVNSHLKTAQGREFSVFASFFRIVLGWNQDKQQFDYAHAVTWAVIDVENKQYYADPLLDPSAPWVLKKQLESGEHKLDPRVRRAFLEVCEKHKVPLPDRVFKDAAECPMDKLAINLQGNTFVKNNNGSYQCHCFHPSLGFAFDLTFTPQKAVVRHGHGGVVKIGLKGDDMFYYFIPRCGVEGKVVVENESFDVSGQGWYDHEFGGTIRHKKTPKGASPTPEEKSDSDSDSASRSSSPVRTKNKMDYAWNWLSLQLEDGTDITATTVIDPEDMTILDNFSVVIDPNGVRTEYCDDDSVFSAEQMWTSLRTTSSFPVRYNLSIPKANINLKVEAAFENQECITVIAKPSFWEGRMNISGTINSRPVSGLGFVERHGFPTADHLSKFFKKVSGMVQEEIRKVMPTDGTYEQYRNLIADEDNDHYMDGLDTTVFNDTVVKPIREIVDRGGKAWRSYALLLCVDAVGGDSYPLRHWLSMPEIMHVGSLIVDDIQDESEVRRGGVTAHKIYGVPLAINAGTAAYFLSVNILKNKTKGYTDQDRLRMYDTYFLTLRAAHAGQALDIAGLDYMMDEVCRTGNNLDLLKRVVCTHRLKSAVPAGNLARMGVMAGHGTHEQEEALARYFESIGIAFQIIDDVLNLRGLPGKTRGEDLMQGKITYPVAVAMNGSNMSLEERKQFWARLKSKPQDQKVVDAMVEIIENCGALNDAEQHANDLVEDAWNAMDQHLPESIYKIHLRAFGWYVLQRHY